MPFQVQSKQTEIKLRNSKSNEKRNTGTMVIHYLTIILYDSQLEWYPYAKSEITVLLSTFVIATTIKVPCTIWIIFDSV